MTKEEIIQIQNLGPTIVDLQFSLNPPIDVFSIPISTLQLQPAQTQNFSIFYTPVVEKLSETLLRITATSITSNQTVIKSIPIRGHGTWGSNVVTMYYEDFTDVSGWIPPIDNYNYNWVWTSSIWSIENNKLVVIRVADTSDLLLPSIPTPLTLGTYKLSFKMSTYTGGQVSIKLRHVNTPSSNTILGTAYANSVGEFEVEGEITESINANEAFIYVDSKGTDSLAIDSAIDWIKLVKRES